MNDILKHSTMFLLLISIALPIISWITGVQNPYFAYLLAVPFFLMYFIRNTVNSLFVFLISHLAILVVVYFLPLDFGLKVICIIFTVFCLILSLYDRLTEAKSGLTIAFLILNAAVNIAVGIVITTFELNIPGTFFVANMIAAILFYLIYSHNMDIGESIQAITLTSSQPIKSIKKFNNAAIAIFLSFVGIAAILSGLLPVEAVLRGLGNGFVAVLRFLLSRERPEPDVEYVPEPPPMQMGNELQEWMMQETRGPFILWVILERILMFLFAAAIITGIIAGIIYLCYMLYKKFYALKKIHADADLKEFIAPDITIETIAARLFKLAPVFGFSPEQRVRRQFYKKVKKHMKTGLKVQNSDTAKEIAAMINKKENIDELTKLYEKARYSQLNESP